MFQHEFQPGSATAPPQASVEARCAPSALLPDRAQLGPALDRQIAKCRRNAKALLLLCISPDGLDAVALRYGPAVRHQVVHAVWGRLRSGLRTTDLALRLGNDEFSAMVLDAAEGAESLVRTRLAAALSQPYRIGNHEIVVQVRVGAAAYPQSGHDGEAILRVATQDKGTQAA